MTPSSKRQRAIENRKNSILNAAEHFFVQYGYDSTTLRKIAAAVEINPATIYNYYKNKEEVFFALQKRAFTRFYEEFEDLRSSELKGSTKLKRMGRRYVNFALKNRNYYELMFIMKKPMKAAEAADPSWKIGSKNYDLLKDVLQECIDEKSISINNVDTAAFMVWSMIHGLVSLVIMERCQMMLEENLDYVLREAHTMFEKLLLK